MSRSWPADPEDVALAIEAVNIVTAGAAVSWSLHVCYGNRYARPLWEGHYDFLFPAVKQTGVDVLALEFARTGDSDLVLLEQHRWDRGLGLGVIDVKTQRVETPEQVAARIRRALRVVPPDRLVINPDCGLRHLPPEVSRAKLAAMASGAAQVRAELGAAAVAERVVPGGRVGGEEVQRARVGHRVAVGGLLRRHAEQDLAHRHLHLLAGEGDRDVRHLDDPVRNVPRGVLGASAGR